MPKTKATPKRRPADAPLDPEKIAAIMAEEPAPNAELVTVFPLSAEEALRRAMNPPKREGSAGEPKGGDVVPGDMRPA